MSTISGRRVFDEMVGMIPLELGVGGGALRYRFTHHLVALLSEALALLVRVDERQGIERGLRHKNNWGVAKW